MDREEADKFYRFHILRLNQEISGLIHRWEKSDEPTAIESLEAMPFITEDDKQAFRTKVIELANELREKLEDYDE